MPRNRCELDRVMEAVECSRLKREYTGLFEELTAYLYEQDPMGLNGINPDEYECEVGTILPRIFDAESPLDVDVVVREEFERWFGPRLKIENATYEDLALGIVRILDRYRSSPRDTVS